jgi:hypothetical protein
MGDADVEVVVRLRARSLTPSLTFKSLEMNKGCISCAVPSLFRVALRKNRGSACPPVSWLT